MCLNSHAHVNVTSRSDPALSALSTVVSGEPVRAGMGSREVRAGGGGVMYDTYQPVFSFRCGMVQYLRDLTLSGGVLQWLRPLSRC